MNSAERLHTGKRVRFLSLKWKVGLVVTVVLVVVNLSITLVAYRQSNQQFYEQKLDLLQQQRQTLSNLLQRDYEQLTSFASFIPLFSTGAAPVGGMDDLATVFARHSAMLSLEWGIESLRFYDKSGRLMLNWSDAPDNERERQLIESTLANDMPVGHIDCAPGCMLTLAVPQLEGALRGGVLVISRSIANNVLEFSRLSGSEVAVLALSAEGNGDHDGRRFLHGWQAAVPALSNPERTFGVLEALQAAMPMERLYGNLQTIRVNDSWYACILTRESAAGLDTAFLIANPISEDVEKLVRANRIILGGGLAGMLATGVILLAFLWKPMARIRRLVAALPALGRNDFSDLRKTLPTRDNALVSDEIDVVVASVDRLALDMETALEARLEAEQNLVWLADHDPLTNLYNRRRFQEIVDRLLTMSVRYGRTGALFFLDLDQFKVVNDLSGHQAGDALLLLVADSLRDSVRQSDVLSRLGGDEFALVLPEANAEQAVFAANKLLHDLKHVEFSAGGRTHRISSSIGIAMFPTHGENLGDLLANADMAMYQAKEAGGDRWHMYAPDEQAKELLETRTRWRECIDQALLDDAFELHYQPIFDIAADQVTRFETLVRMRDQAGELVFPDHFIPVAEQSGQIHQIDRWVIGKAIEQIRSSPDLVLSVNLSGRVLDDPLLLEWFHGELSNSAIDPARLIVEITETAAVANVQDAIAFMQQIKRLGCRFALDDFGSGFSSFTYLKQLPVDIVKIDGAFIRHLASSKDDQLFVKALTDVAKGLGKTTVAEFVEDAETLRLLERFGVDYAQGYFIGRPSPHRKPHAATD
jgi:diguanylate cyclase (GGDEF)-like protein